MNNMILEIAKEFDRNVLSVQFIVKYRNIIYKAICKEYSFILRFTNQRLRTKEQIESELRFQTYLFENNANVTKPLSTAAGESISVIEMEGEQYFVSAFSFAYGKDWDERVDESPEVFFNIGRVLGKIHNLSKSYKPISHKRRMWYEQQELIEAERLFKSYDIELYNAYIVFRDELKKSNTDQENFGLTHGDYLMSNYLIDNNTVTVIDFDECEYSWFAMDLAICIRCYLVGAEPEKVSEKRDIAEKIHYNLLRGYNSENTITNDMIYDLNKYIWVRDYIEIAQLLRSKEQGRELCNIENRLLEMDLNRVLHKKSFLEFDLSRVSEFENEKIDFDTCTLQALSEKTLGVICQWEYEEPYNVYNFKDRPNEYLLKKDTWGSEQFCLAYNDRVVGQVACQFDNEDLWVGWSLSPAFCGKGNGYLFVRKCVEEIRKNKNYKGSIYLRVAAANIRAIKAYQQAGFIYHSTIQDEVAYSNNIEDFWVMVNQQ